jgi:acetoacetate decarboxylase
MIHGKLTKKKMVEAGTMPVDAPLFHKLPIYYHNTERHIMKFNYETDEEAALAVLPDLLQFKPPAVARMNIMRTPFCTLGSYQEAFLTIKAYWEGELVEYIVYNLVSNDAAAAVGREVWGVPKKIATVDVQSLQEAVIGTVERPAGTEIVRGVIRPEGVKVAEAKGNPINENKLVSLRIIPHPEGKDPLIQLIIHYDPEQANWVSGETWKEFIGPGSISFPAKSAADPWHKFPVKKMLESSYAFGPASSELHYGKILSEY